MKKRARTCTALLLSGLSACMFSPQDGTVIDDFAGFPMTVAVPNEDPSNPPGVEVSVADVANPSSDADWSSIGSFAVSGTYPVAGAEWGKADLYVPIEAGQWFAVPGGFRARVRSRWDGYNLFSMDDYSCLSEAETPEDLLPCTAGKMLNVYAPGSCPAQSPTPCDSCSWRVPPFRWEPMPTRKGWSGLSRPVG